MSSIFGLSLLSFLVSSALIIAGMFIFGNIDMILVICCLVQSYFQFVATAMTTKYMMKVDYIRKTLLLALPNLTIQVIAIFTIMNMHGDKNTSDILSHTPQYIWWSEYILSFRHLSEEKAFKQIILEICTHIFPATYIPWSFTCSSVKFRQNYDYKPV